MLKGKSCLDFNEFNSFHNKTSTDQETPQTTVSISFSTAWWTHELQRKI